MSKCKSVILCSFQSFTLQWGHNISWVSCANQLQPAYSISDYVYLLLNINNQAVFGTINTTDGSSFTNVYVSSETWTWVSFVKSASSYVVIGFQDSSTSYINCSVIYPNTPQVWGSFCGENFYQVYLTF